MKVTKDGATPPLSGSLSVSSTGTSDDLEWTTSPIGVIGALDDLTDVNAPTPIDLDVLTWDDGTGMWVAQAPTDPTTFRSHILLADGHSAPFSFDDMLQLDDGSDFAWSDA